MVGQVLVSSPRMKWNIYIHTWIRGVYNAPRSWHTFIVIYLKPSMFSWLKCTFPFNMSRSTPACIPVTIIKLQWRFYYMYPWNGLVTNISWHLTYLRKHADCHGFVCDLAGWLFLIFRMEVQACGGKSISSTASYRYICVDPSEFLEGGGHFSGCVEETCFWDYTSQLFNGVFQRWGREQDIATSTLGSILGESTGTEKSWLSDGEFSGKCVLPIPETIGTSSWQRGGHKRSQSWSKRTIFKGFCWSF